MHRKSPTHSMAGAEIAYLFRHALLREAAYQLQLPGSRARLHGLALEIVEDLFAGNENALDQLAEELADHAKSALLTDDRSHDSQGRLLLEKELSYCRRAANNAARSFQNQVCAAFNQRIAEHKLASEDEAARCLAEASRVKLLAGATSEAEQLAHRALAGARLGATAATLSGVHLQLARCLSVLVKHTDAQKNYELAVSYARQCADPGLLADSLIALARHNEAQEHLDAIFGPLAEADALLAKAGNLSGRAEIATLLASVEHHKTHDTSRCLAMDQMALELARKAGSIVTESRVLHAMGVICADAGRADEAESCYIRSLALAEQIGDRPRRASLVHNLAQLDNFFRYRFRAALVRYEEALRENREMGLAGPESSEAATIAAVYRRLGRATEAEPYSLRALELMTGKDTDWGFVNATGYLADVQLALGRIEEAERGLRFAVAEHTRLGRMQQTLTEFHEDLGRLLRQTGRLRAADQHFEKAQQLYDESKQSRWSTVLMLERGLMELDAGRPGGLAQQAAIRLAEQIPKFKQLPPRPRLRFFLLPVLRACLLAVGEFTPARMPELLALADEAASVGELRDLLEISQPLGALHAAYREVELAKIEGRAPLLFSGYLPLELPALQRLARIERLKATRPAEYAALERECPELLQCMLEGTRGLAVPRWDEAETF